MFSDKSEFFQVKLSNIKTSFSTTRMQILRHVTDMWVRMQILYHVTDMWAEVVGFTIT